MKSKIYVLMAAAALLTLGGCKKETGELVTMTFDVELADAAHKQGTDVKMAKKGIDMSAEAKVYLNENKPCWRKGDAIHINDGDGTVTSVAAENPTRGRFEATFNTNSDYGYLAVYPSFIGHQKADLTKTSYNLCSSTPTVYLPRVQIFDTVKLGTEANAPVHQKINAPMFAYNPEYPVLQFRNLCGMLKITVKNTKAWDMVLDSIQVEATHYNLCGEMTIQGYNTIQEYSNTEPYLAAPAGSAADSFDVENRMNYQTVSLAKAGNASLGMYLRSTRLKAAEAGNTNAPTDTTLYIYIPTTTSGSNHLFYVRVFSHPAWQTGSNIFTPDPEVHISYEKRQTNSVAISRNNLYNFTIELDDNTVKPTFTSLKPFTVSNSNSKVSISRGNAQYFILNYNGTTDWTNETDALNITVAYDRSSNGHWRFAPRQWSFLYKTHMKHADYGLMNWIEHFTWDSGQKPLHHGVDNGSLSGHRHFRDWSGDWGDNFTNGTWSTLSIDNIHYLLKERTAVDGSIYHNFAWVELDATDIPGHWGSTKLYGVLVMPDGFGEESANDNYAASRAAAGLGSMTHYNGHNTTTSALIYYGREHVVLDGELPGEGDIWVRYRNNNAMTIHNLEYYEARGCIFLPCIGVFDGNGNSNDDWRENHPECSIWSSTKHDDGGTDSFQLELSADTPNDAADCRSGEHPASQGYDAERYRKFNVRLVRSYSNNNGADYIYDPFQ